MIGGTFSGQSKKRAIIVDEKNSDRIDNDRETGWKRDGRHRREKEDSIDRHWSKSEGSYQ